jgi:hypothetical protein
MRAMRSVTNPGRYVHSFPPYHGKWTLGTSLSKRTSLVPSPNTAWKRSSTCFVVWDLHRGA